MKNIAGASVRENEPLAHHSPFRAGGNCPHWVVVHRREALIEFVQQWAKAGQRFSVLGAGTKTLFRNGGVNHSVIRLGHGFQHSEYQEGVWTLGAALPLNVARYRMSQLGSDPLSVLGRGSGTIGGLIATLNDSKWHRVQEVVEAVETVGQQGYRWRPVATLKKVPKLVTSIRLKHVQSADKNEFQCENVAARWFVGSGDVEQKRLMIRRVEMSGARLRGVLMPVEMPEYLVNIGGGTSSDFWELHRSVLDRIRRFHGVEWTCGLKWQGRK